MMEKRYEIIRGKETDGRNPPGMNAVGGTEGLEKNILEDRTRYEMPAPRSSLNNAILIKTLSKEARETRAPKRTRAAAPEVRSGKKGKKRNG